MTAPVALSRADKVAAIRSSLAANPSWTHLEVANELGMTLGALRNLINDPDGSKQRSRRRRYQRPCPGCGTLMDGSNGRSGPPRCLACTRLLHHEARKWTAEAVVDAIQRFAAVHGRPPTASEWITADPVNGYPARSTVYRTRSGWKNAPFASWGDAIEAAGFPRPLIGMYERTDAWRADRSVAGIAWTRDRIITAIQRWHRTHGRVPGMRDWTPAGPDWPSSCTVVGYFGAWNAAIAAAGFAPRQSGRQPRLEAA